MKVDPEKCISCGKCESSCMVVHYYDKIMAGRSAPAPQVCGTRPQQKSQRPGNKGKYRPQNRRPDNRKGGNRRR
jgi:phosphoadenosine phosphosulfate reductase